MGLAKVMRVCCMISNSTAIAEVFSRIGTSGRAWRRVSSQRHVRTLLPSRRITRRSASRRLRERVRRKATATSSELPLPVNSHKYEVGQNTLPLGEKPAEKEK